MNELNKANVNKGNERVWMRLVGRIRGATEGRGGGAEGEGEGGGGGDGGRGRGRGRTAAARALESYRNSANSYS